MYASDLKHGNSGLAEKLLHLYQLKKGSKIELSFRKPYLGLLAGFGNPHLDLPPVIHVAGTNGKGSVVAMLRAILGAAGYKVHTYTSPHLVEFNERIVLAGQQISDNALEALIDEAVKLNKNNEITFFEITTAMAFAAFARTPADVLILETGLGGRLDCTNVVPRPIATIITKIGLDHVEYLGDTLGKIATEKAGIIKPNAPCILSAQDDPYISNLIRETCGETGSTLFAADAEWFSEPNADQFRFVFKTVGESVDKFFPAPNLKGLHQIENAGAALAALRVIADRLPVTDDAITHGLKNISWPGRLENVTPRLEKFMQKNWPRNWEVFLDGAHNQDAARALSTEAAQWAAKDGKKLHVIVGMMGHKNPREFLAPLIPHAASLHVVGIPGEPAAFTAQQLKKDAPVNMPAHIDVQDHTDFLESIKAITSNNPPGRILITGSLYLAGHILKTLA